MVVILTAHGLKYAGAGVRYHCGELPGLVPDWPNPPLPVDADVTAIERALGLA